MNQIGIVPQDAYLFNKTIYDNLVAGKEDIAEAKIENVLRAVRIYDEIMQMSMGMNTVISEMGTNLSGGQRQRIIIARELLKKPSLLLLDEAISALDYTNEKRILEYISGLKITCLIVTHRISSIQNADHILLGIDKEPAIHTGANANALERKGIQTKRGNINREIVKRNMMLEQAKAMLDLARQEVQSIQYAGVISYNKNNLEGELQNESRRHNRQQGRAK